MALLALGSHVFEIAPLNFQQLMRETTVKFPAIARFGQRPSPANRASRTAVTVNCATYIAAKPPTMDANAGCAACKAAALLEPPNARVLS